MEYRQGGGGVKTRGQNLGTSIYQWIRPSTSNSATDTLKMPSDHLNACASWVWRKKTGQTQKLLSPPSVKHKHTHTHKDKGSCVWTDVNLQGKKLLADDVKA